MKPKRWMSIADPIHGIIRLDRDNPSHRLVIDVMNAPTFQRLRRIKQMGLAEFVFPSATHSRFAHSVGAMHLMVELLTHFNHDKETRALLDSPYEDTNIPLHRLLLLGIMVHDIGHSPLSHTLEDVLGLKEQGLHHDHYWNYKILTEAPDMLAVWGKHDPDLPRTLKKFLGDDGAPRHFLSTLISSQLDMDRMDYLQRDSHFLGVKYGQIEDERIIENLELTQLADGTPVVAVSIDAIPAVEHYLFGRHQAYKMALHPLDKASEMTLKKTLKRFEHCRNNNIKTGDDFDELYRLMSDGKSLTTEEYLRMDDHTIWEALGNWNRQSEDPWLKALAGRMLSHDILKFVDLRKYGFKGSLEDLPDIYNALKTHYVERDLDFEVGFEELEIWPKAMYVGDGTRSPIWINTDLSVVDLKEASTLPVTERLPHGTRHLIFVWDRTARSLLKKLLRSHFGVDV